MANSENAPYIIINPTAGNGGAGHKIDKIKEMAGKFFSGHRIMVTDGPGHATDYARQASEKGVGLLICVGGDGTLNEVVNGLLSGEMARQGRPALGYLPTGTGSDFARTLKITNNIELGLRNIARNQGRQVDVGLANFCGRDGRETRRYFFNVLSFALGGEVAGRVNRSNKTFGGLSFLWATLTALTVFNKPLVRLRIDEKTEVETKCWQVAVANGQYQGGGMNIAPDARIDDGRLRLTVVGDLSLPEVLVNLPRLYNGNIYGADKVARYTVKKIEAGSPGIPVLIDLDGEQVGCLPLKIEVVPRAFWFVH